MKNLKIDAEFTYNILRNIKGLSFDDIFEKLNVPKNADIIENNYMSPRHKDYVKSLHGMKLILESLLLQKHKEPSNFESIEDDNREYSKLARNLIRIITTPLPTLNQNDNTVG